MLSVVFVSFHWVGSADASGFLCITHTTLRTAAVLYVLLSWEGSELVGAVSVEQLAGPAEKLVRGRSPTCSETPNERAVS